jgi:hypothetical protein
MATFTKLFLSESTSGNGIPVGETGVTLHTASVTEGVIDEVWLYASNNDSSTREVKIVWGDLYSDNDFSAQIPPLSGLVLLVPGLIIGDGLLVSAEAEVDSAITIYGYVHRIG